MLADRREALTRRRVQTVDRLQALLAELLPGQAKKDITTGQAKTMLASVRPRDIAGKTRRRIAAEELAELVAVEAKMKKATAELKAMVLARGSRLMDLRGVGPVVAARILADVGDVARFADRNRFASWTGTAPLDASSGEQSRHRLSRAGNRRVNHMIHIAAISQIRLDTDGRAYYRRKRAAGKRPARSDPLPQAADLRRHLPPARRRRRGQRPGVDAGPGGHCGATQESSAAGSHPHTGTSDQPLPGPAPTTLRPVADDCEETAQDRRLTTEGSRKDPGSSPRESRDQRELHVRVERIRNVRSDRLEDTGQSQSEQHQSEDDCDGVRKGYMRPQQDVVEEARVRAYVVPRFWHTGVLLAHRSYGRLSPLEASEPLEALRLKAPDALRGCVPAPVDQW